MFDTLRKKLKNWLGTEEKKPKKSKVSKKKSEKTEPKKKGKKQLEKKLKKELHEKTENPPKANATAVAREEIITPVEVEEPKEKEGFFARFTKKLTSSKLTKEQFDELFAELEIILLENNVAVDVVEKIRKDLEEQLVGTEVKKDKLDTIILSSLKKSIENVLHEPPNLIDMIKKKEGIFTILFFGINGSGKTTSVAKLAHYLKKNNITSVMAAGDTFRAASIEQLETHGTRLNVPVVKQQYGADPAAVAFDAKKYAQSHHIKVVLIDTAGRMYTRENLMKEMEKIVRVSQPDLKLFVGESITGNDATEQARMFNETAGIDGLILTKADVDDKGGTALSVSHVTGKPIYFLGMGQSYDDLKPFKKELVLQHLGLD